MAFFIYLFWIALPIWIICLTLVALLVCAKIFKFEIPLLSDDSSPLYYLMVYYLITMGSYWFTDIGHLSAWSIILQMCYKGLIITFVFLFLKHIYKEYFMVDQQDTNRFIGFLALLITIGYSSYYFGFENGCNVGKESALKEIKHETGNRIYSESNMHAAWNMGWNAAVNNIKNDRPNINISEYYIYDGNDNSGGTYIEDIENKLLK